MEEGLLQGSCIDFCNSSKCNCSWPANLGRASQNLKFYNLQPRRLCAGPWWLPRWSVVPWSPQHHFSQAIVMPASTAARSSTVQVVAPQQQQFLPGLKMALQVTQRCKKLLVRGWKRDDRGGIKDVQDMHVWVLRVKKTEKDGAAGGQHCGCSTVRV